MAKNKNLINNTFYNFKLRGRPSILIGLYFILGSIFIQSIIKGFYTDNSPFSFLTVNYFESFITIITLLVFLFSLLALFFSNRRYARKIGNKVWNKNSKKSFWYLLILISGIYASLFFLLQNGLEQYIISAFLILYGFLLVILNFSKGKEIYYLSMVSFSLGLLSLLYIHYGFSSIFILGISHLVLGISIKH